MLRKHDDRPGRRHVELGDAVDGGDLRVIEPCDAVGGVAHMLKHVVHVYALLVRPEKHAAEGDIAGPWLIEDPLEVRRRTQLGIDVFLGAVRLALLGEARAAFACGLTVDHENLHLSSARC
jgi:hypothetical protein